MTIKIFYLNDQIQLSYTKNPAIYEALVANFDGANRKHTGYDGSIFIDTKEFSSRAEFEDLVFAGFKKDSPESDMSFKYEKVVPQGESMVQRMELRKQLRKATDEERVGINKELEKLLKPSQELLDEHYASLASTNTLD